MQQISESEVHLTVTEQKALKRFEEFLDAGLDCITANWRCQDLFPEITNSEFWRWLG